MDAKEALGLLSRWAVDDRREVNAVIARSWADRFWDTPAYLVHEAAERVLDAGGYIDQQAIKKTLRAMRPRLESDVRSAKARGIVDGDWPKDQPLTPEAAELLRAARQRDFEATNDSPDELAAGGARRAIDPGVRPKEIR